MRPSTTQLVTIALVTAFLLPAISQAASLTTDQVNSVISLLQSFNVDTHTVQTVQAVLTNAHPSTDGTVGMMGTSTLSGHGRPSLEGAPGRCLPPVRNLTLGSQGDDVKNLQNILANDPTVDFQGATTGYFGPMTAQAMMRFQENYHIASSTTGSVGPRTRQFLEQHCGKIGNRLPPVPGMGMASGTPHEPLTPLPAGTQRDY